MAIACAIAIAFLATHCKVPEPPSVGPDMAYRLIQSRGAWWISDGRRKVQSIGICAVIAEDVDFTRGGIRYPKAYNGPAAHGGDRESWKRSVLARTQSWGFNTMGAWCDADVANPNDFMQTPCIWLGGYRSTPDNRLVDVWNPAYAVEMERIAAEQLAPWHGRSDVLGFFINNELPWYGEAGWPIKGGRTLLDRYLELPPSAPGRKQVVEWLRRYYSEDWSRFTREWTVNVDSFESLATDPRIALEIKRPAANEAVEAWAGIVAEHYFKLSDAIFRRHAPTNALNLGVRFAGRNFPSVMAAAARYVDVLSYNDYQPDGQFKTNYFDALYELVRKPILISEFSWRANENRSGCRNSQGAPVTVPTQRDRAEHYARYVEAALRHPAILGVHWFCWADQPPEGRFDGEDSNYGIVDIYDEPYHELTAAMTLTHRTAPLQREALRPAPVNMTPLMIYRPIEIPGGPDQLTPASVAVQETKPRLWFDTAHADFSITNDSDRILLRASSRSGSWGGGISLHIPPSHVVSSSDGFSLLGRTGVELRVNASQRLFVRLQLVESGAGPVGEQAYTGDNGADGEVYITPLIELSPGDQSIQIEWADLDVHQHFGNQRGNRRLDLQAIRSIDLYIPGDPNPPGTFDLALNSLVLN